MVDVFYESERLGASTQLPFGVVAKNYPIYTLSQATIMRVMLVHAYD